jgi:ArsR family transcriptional regulator, arsenate/arsenite/antimonite-responsive transcriptional repressor
VGERRRFKVVVEEEFDRASGRAPGPGGDQEERVTRLVALGQALSDPIRVRMLGMMGEGHDCCDLPDLGVPACGYEGPGICVCEFEDYFGMGQSWVSYYMRKLKDAVLVREKRRGKWSFYSLDEEAVRGLLDIARRQLAA